MTKEKIAFKINYNDYLENKEEVYDLTRSGFQIALYLDETFQLNEESTVLLKVFTYVVTNNHELYNILKKQFQVLYIPS